MKDRWCKTCVKRKTIYCPNSKQCFATENKPYYQNRIMLLEENQKYKEVINKAIKILGNYKHYSTPDEEQNSDNEDLVNKTFDILKEVEHE